MPAAENAPAASLPSAMKTGISGRMRLMLRDVEVANAEGEIDRVEILERGRQQREVRRRAKRRR